MSKIIYSTIIALVVILIIGVGYALAMGPFSFWGKQLDQMTLEEIVVQYNKMFQKHAEILGMDVNQYKDKWAEGKSFREIAQEQGLTKEQLQEKIKEFKKEQVKTRLDKLVKAGVITQEQANKRLESIQKKFENTKECFCHQRGFKKKWRGF